MPLNDGLSSRPAVACKLSTAGETAAERRQSESAVVELGPALWDGMIFADNVTREAVSAHAALPECDQRRGSSPISQAPSPVESLGDNPLMMRSSTVPENDRRLAVAELGEAMRAIAHSAVLTEADADSVLAAAADVRSATARLNESQRPLTTPSSLDSFERGVRMYNPVVGLGSAIAVPLAFEPTDEGVLAHAVLGPAFEGPPLHVHGGISSLLMDQVLATAISAQGRWGMTAGLELRYRLPVPLNTPLVLTARVTEASERVSKTAGTIALASAPEVALVEATALFITPSAKQVEAYFGAMRQATEVMGTDAAN